MRKILRIFLYCFILINQIILAENINATCQPTQYTEVPNITNQTYHEARKSLINKGWQPNRTLHNNDIDSLSAMARSFWDIGYTEVRYCYPTGAAACSFLFKDVFGNQLEVYTEGEEDTQEKMYAQVKLFSFFCDTPQNVNPPQNSNFEPPISSWEKVANSNMGSFFIDPSKIKLIQPGLLQVWVKGLYNQPVKEQYGWVSSFLLLETINCDRRVFKTNHTVSYDNGGNVLFDSPIQGKENIVAPNTIYENVIVYACKYAKQNIGPVSTLSNSIPTQTKDDTVKKANWQPINPQKINSTPFIDVSNIARNQNVIYFSVLNKFKRAQANSAVVFIAHDIVNCSERTIGYDSMVEINVQGKIVKQETLPIKMEIAKPNTNAEDIINYVCK